MRRLIRLTPLRHLAAADVARRNAATAAAVLAAAGRERESVDAFVEAHLLQRAKRAETASA